MNNLAYVNEDIHDWQIKSQNKPILSWVFFTEYISAILIWTKWQHKTYGKLSFVLHCTFYTQELYLQWSQIQWTDNNYLTYKYISHLTLRASCNMCLMNFHVQTRCSNSAASISTGRHKLQHEHEPQKGIVSSNQEHFTLQYYEHQYTVHIWTTDSIYMKCKLPIWRLCQYSKTVLVQKKTKLSTEW